MLLRSSSSSLILNSWMSNFKTPSILSMSFHHLIHDENPTKHATSYCRMLEIDCAPEHSAVQGRNIEMTTTTHHEVLGSSEEYYAAEDGSDGVGDGPGSSSGSDDSESWHVLRLITYYVHMLSRHN